MNEINTIGLCRDARAIVDVLEGIEHDLKGMSGAMDYRASTYKMAITSIFSIGEEIHYWLAEDVAEIGLNGASFKKANQTMNALDYMIERLYDVMDRISDVYWRDEIYDNIKKLAGLYEPMIRVMEMAVIKHARGE